MYRGPAWSKEQAEQEGLDKIFVEAGFEWREPGCSMCLAMNADRLEPGERCASTSNRNFEGRQGRGGRTHLVSPAMAAAAAITGKLSDVREILAVNAGPDRICRQRVCHHEVVFKEGGNHPRTIGRHDFRDGAVG